MRIRDGRGGAVAGEVWGAWEGVGEGCRWGDGGVAGGGASEGAYLRAGASSYSCVCVCVCEETGGLGVTVFSWSTALCHG